MAGRRTRYYTAEEVRRIVMDVPDDSDISDFEGQDEDDASDMSSPARTLMIQTIRKGLLSTKIIR